VQLDTDQVRADDGHRPAQVRLVHAVVFDIGRGEVLYPAQQLIVVADTQTQQRVSAQYGQRFGGAPQQQTGTALMLQQHGHYLVFAFLDQEGGEIEDPYIPVAGRQRIAGRHSDVVYASQPGHSIILTAARQLVNSGPHDHVHVAELARKIGGSKSVIEAHWARHSVGRHGW
jgi:hypothetical protein